jgi:hypothetical protein
MADAEVDMADTTNSIPRLIILCMVFEVEVGELRVVSGG